MRCPWLEERPLVKLTSVSVTVISCLEAAPAYCFGDFGQLPPVMDLPLYTTVSQTAVSDLGSTAYQLFDHAIVLDQVMCQSGEDDDQVRYCNILLRMRDGEVTEDWQHLMKQTQVQVQDLAPFCNALHLYPTIEAVAEHNVTKLRASGQPIVPFTQAQMHPRLHLTMQLDWTQLFA